MVSRCGRSIHWSALCHAALAGAQQAHSASYRSTHCTCYSKLILYLHMPMPTQVQSVLHRVPRLHQLAPDIFPAYTLPGIRTPDSSMSRVEARVSASTIPGPGDAADMMHRGHVAVN